VINFESNVIGALMLDNSAIASVRTILAPEEFQNSDFSEIYRCMLELTDKSAPCDVLSLAEALLNDKYTTSIGLEFLGDTQDCTASAANVEYYAEQVKDQALKRKVQSIIHTVADCETGAEAVEQVLQQLTQVGCGNNKTSFHINDALNEVTEEIEGIFNNTTQFIKSGLEQLDSKIYGFTGGLLYIIGARPSMGKTSLMLNIAAKAAKDGMPTKIFSLEIPKKSCAYKMVCAASNLNTRAKHDMQDEDWNKLSAGFLALKDQPIEFDERSGYGISYLKNSIRTHHQKHGRGFYLIDYLQLMKINGDDRVKGIGEISRELKGLAKEIDSPIVLISQLNRGLEQRPDKRPIMSDLRESGELEADADVIIMIYRDEVYNEDSPAIGIAELIVRKHREGEIGTAFVSARLQYSRFDNLSKQDLQKEV